MCLIKVGDYGRHSHFTKIPKTKHGAGEYDKCDKDSDQNANSASIDAEKLVLEKSLYITLQTINEN